MGGDSRHTSATTYNFFPSSKLTAEEAMDRGQERKCTATLLTWTTGEEEEEEEATLVFSLRRDVRGLGTAVVKFVAAVECRN